ncbi:MAG: hypothetical protein N2109_13595, partial [Fimbriimonadales bacterium]|nr:hypothetical protein [Fimbriimonadales bacterium]
ESARQLRTQARLWREIRELMEIVGEQAGDFDADRAKAVLERGASPFEPNLETQRVMEIKRELRDQLEWMVSHLEGQNIFEEIRGTLRALVYT